MKEQFPVDQSLLRKSGEKSFFNHRLVTIGIDCCYSAASTRQFAHVPEGLDFRITVVSDELVRVWVNEKQWQNYKRMLEKKKRKPWLLPVDLLFLIFLSVGVGFLWLFFVWVIGKIFNLDCNLAIAFWISFCLSALGLGLRIFFRLLGRVYF